MNTHQVRTLSNLQPETVAAVEGVPFVARMLALPEVQDVRDSLDEVHVVGAASKDEMIDVRAELRIQPDAEERMVVMPKFVVATGLCFDDDAGHCNPLEQGCGNGNLHHRGRRASGSEEAASMKQWASIATATEISRTNACPGSWQSTSFHRFARTAR